MSDQHDPCRYCGQRPTEDGSMAHIPGCRYRTASPTAPTARATPVRDYLRDPKPRKPKRTPNLPGKNSYGYNVSPRRAS